MNVRIALELGRVSNLPTVWTNVMAAAALAGGDIAPWDLAIVGLATSLLYVGGMFLNDAFDARIDAAERPERPIPRGAVTQQTVAWSGAALLGTAVTLLLVRAWMLPQAGIAAAIAAAGTAGLIVLYDLWHKGNPVGPVIMGACRLGVYLIAAYAVTPDPPTRVFTGGLLLLGYVVGLTWVAKHEDDPQGQSRVVLRSWPVLLLFAPVVWALPALRHDLLLRGVLIAFCLWVMQALDKVRAGRARQAVGTLIAGIALVDAIVVARYSTIEMTIAALAAFGITIYGHRRIAGT